ncbi:hypothetical protein GGX14DRAFT_399343 [Mycena pura]|uniref:Uncharacterized protein n=1 Tax=Mycena pura TaxID=153505 RepID=A0AAD6UKE3_9AGAR|nr:hypothetical protein GGX14DRAFT_409067 [Mycena pura]KAJ7202570.1 hypothetical protein GGX14DRAFT_399343 [Mycena pura]
MASNTDIELNVGNIRMSIHTSLSPGDTLSIQTNLASPSAPSVKLSLLSPVSTPMHQERVARKRTAVKRPRKITKRVKTSNSANPDAVTTDVSETEDSETDEVFYAARSSEDPSRPVRILRRVVHNLPIICFNRVGVGKISPGSKKQVIPANVPRPHPDAMPVFIRPANMDRGLAVAEAVRSCVEGDKMVAGPGKIKVE